MSLDAALTALGVNTTPGARLDRLVYWRVGGPAERLVDVNSVARLRGVMALGEPVTVLGRGSNALVHDDGVPGLTLRLSGELAELNFIGPDRAWAGAGLGLTALINRLDKAGVAGAEPFAGVPGTVGGAVVMNAGTTLGEAKDLVEAVELVLPGGDLLELPAEALAFAYRHAELPPGAILTRALLRLRTDDVEGLITRRKALLERRKQTQPLDLPSCGSTFTNPPGDFAGRLIEAAGLKGAQIGGAQVSPKHANFFVNTGDATAAQLAALIRLARRSVRDQFGVLLTPEVRLIGPWPDDALSPDRAD
ncbi:UDP-N-acetylmuramate dehydrogenase [Myxococcota bacterium]|nr:UDP-N-acetylmuramate dehydrogenase [Myxococcota bacterium]